MSRCRFGSAQRMRAVELDDQTARPNTLKAYKSAMKKYNVGYAGGDGVRAISAMAWPFPCMRHATEHYQRTDASRHSCVGVLPHEQLVRQQGHSREGRQPVPMVHRAAGGARHNHHCKSLLLHWHCILVSCSLHAGARQLVLSIGCHPLSFQMHAHAVRDCDCCCRLLRHSTTCATRWRRSGSSSRQ